ncbi:MAG: 50S ribosomal protein L35 [Bacillota bacterium]|nr:50S ribosomal protein L35 [Bacillota bacterium]
MPKMKTHRGAAKRFRLTARGKIVKKRSFHSHLLETKSPARKRRLRKAGLISDADAPRVRRLLPYA